MQTLASLIQHTWLIDQAAGRFVLRQLLENKAQPAEPAVTYAGVRSSAPSLMGGGTQGAMPGSVVVICVDYPLYGFYADWLCRQLQQASMNENVVGIICRINSPGGVDQAAYKLFDTIQAIKKPKIALCEYGLMASAAYWFALGFDYIMASRATDRIGSIGVYSTFMDDTGFWEQYGFTLKDIYAPESDRKNEEFRAAQEGDYSLYEANNSRVAQLFIAAVKQYRAGKLKITKADDPTRGALYVASDALKNGIIDEIGTADRALQLIARMAAGETIQDILKSEAPDDAGEEDDDPEEDPEHEPDDAPEAAAQIQSSNQNPDTSMFGDKHKKLTALAGQAAVSDEQLNEVNANLDSLGITGVRVISTGYLNEAENAVSALATANTTITTLTAERDSYKAKAEAYGSQPGATPSKVEKAEEPLATATPQVISETDAEMQRMLKKQQGK
ncbi:S49 family peptidase [Arsenicibacter rosenii]|nr:S49 family peptidase [Arsenicibacter rosenii]